MHGNENTTDRESNGKGGKGRFRKKRKGVDRAEPERKVMNGMGK